MQIKFNSGVNKLLTAVIVVYQIIIVLLYSTKIFSLSNFGVNVAIALTVIDVLFVIPLAFMTYYKFYDDYLYIHDYPIRSFKIKYTDIFTVEDGDFETKDKSIVGLSLDRIAIGYYSENSKGEKEKRYVFISPKDMNLFLIRLSSKLKQAQGQIEEQQHELSEKQKEHLRKKEIADKKREELEELNKPQIIKIGAEKAEGKFKLED